MPTKAKVYFASGGQININKLEEQIMANRHGQKLKKKLMEKFHWTTATFQCIDWKNHGEAVKKQDKLKYLKIAKSIFGWQAVNETQHSWYADQNPTDKCPTCGKCTETQEHLFQCDHLASRTFQHKEIEKIGTWARKQKYDNYLISMIQRNLRAWTDDKTNQERREMNKKKKPNVQQPLQGR